MTFLFTFSTLIFDFSFQPLTPRPQSLTPNPRHPATVYILLSNWALAPNPSPLTLGISTSVENSLQISSFMQNKPNFTDAQMNVTPLFTRDYKNKLPLRASGKQTQTNPIPPDRNKRSKTLVWPPIHMHQKKIEYFSKNPCKGRTNNT